MNFEAPSILRRAWLAPATIALLAGLLRAWHLLSLTDAPDWGLPLVDSEVYDSLARGLAEGLPANDGLFWQPLFYPLFLAAVYRTLGSGPWPILILQALLGCITTLMTWRVAHERFGCGAGWIAGLIVAACGPLIFFEAQLLATGWATLHLLLLVWFAAQVHGARGPLPALGFGLLSALACLTRPTFIPVTIALGAWVALAAQGPRLRRAAFCLLGFAALVLPAASWQLALRGSFSPLPVSGGLNLFIGNNAEAERTTAIRPGREWQSLIERPRREGIDDKRGAAEYFRRQARQWIVEHPGAFVRGLGRKSLEFFSSRELPRNLDLYVYREWSPVLRLTTWKIGSFGFPLGVLIPLAAMGLILGGRRIDFPIVAMLALYSAAVVLVFVSARYRAPLIPLLAILAARGLTHLPDALAATRRRAALAVLGAAIVLPLVWLPGPFPQEAGDYRAELHFLLGTRSMNLGHDERAAREFRQALERSPEHADAANHFGIVEVRRGNRRAAIVLFERAVAIDPTFVTARLNLARTLAATGRHDAALAQFARTLERAPENLDARFHMALTLMRVGRAPEALPLLEWIARARPDNPEVAQALERARLEAAR